MDRISENRNGLGSRTIFSCVNVWVILFCLVLITPALAAGEQKNLLMDGDFEEGEAGKMAPSWRTSDSSKCRAPKAQLDDTVYLSGQKALKIEAKAKDEADKKKEIAPVATKEMIPVEAGRIYKFSCWIKAEKSGVKGALLVHDNWGTIPMSVFLVASGREVMFDTEWKEYSLSFRIPKEGDNKYYAERKGIFLRVDLHSDGVIWVDNASVREVKGTAFLNEGSSCKSRWRHLQSGDLIAEFDGSGMGGIWLKGGQPFYHDFYLTSGDKGYRAGDRKGAAIWDEVNYEMKYAPFDLKRCGDEAREIRIFGDAKGLKLDYVISVGKDNVVDFDISAVASKGDIKDFYWLLVLGAYGSTPPDSFLTIIEGDKKKNFSLKKEIPALEVFKWVGLTLAQNWKVDAYLDNTGTAYMSGEKGGAVRIYPQGLKKGMVLEKDKRYRMSFRVKVEELPFYEKPFEVTLKYSSPIFKFPEPISLDISIPESFSPLNVRLLDALDEEVLDGDTLSSPETRDGKMIYRWVYTPPEPGVYELTLSSKDREGKEYKRICEVVSVGRIKQRKINIDTPEKEAFALELVDRIECSKPGDSHPFMDGVDKSKIVDSSIGKYREAGSEHASCMIWEFKIKDLYEPHLVVAEYPDDKPRTISFGITEPPNLCRVSNGVICGYPYPLTNKFQEMSTIYYPTKKTAYFVILTCEEKHPAALKNISIYKILNDLPEAEIKNKAPGRYVGIHTESENTQWVSYSSKSGVRLWRAGTYPWSDMKSDYFYRAWYRTIANHIKDMHYSGQNLFVTGAYRYHAGYYPGCSEVYTQFGNTHPMDYYELMARMFEENDIGLILSVEFLITPRLLTSLRKTSLGGAAKGERTIGQVSNKGGFAKGLGGATLNPFAPEVEGALVKIADEIAARYHKYPSVVGIAFICGDEGFQPCIYRRPNTTENFEFSYDDISIERFEKGKGIKVPVDKKDPARFSKRYEWLMKNAKEEWIQWRCEAMRDLFLKIHKKVYSKRLKCYFLDVRSVMRVVSEERWRTSGMSYRDLLRERGFDPLMYKGVEGLIFGNFFKQNEGRYYVHSACASTGASKPTNGVIREFNMDKEVRELYSSGEDTACFIHNQFYEIYFPFRKVIKWREFTIPNHWSGTDYSWPTRPYFSDPFVTMLAEGDLPSVIMHTFADNESWVGSQDQMREFASAFRTLPIANYKILKGRDFDGNVIIREANLKGEKYLCVINPCWWYADCNISLSSPTKVLELADNKLIEAKGGSFRVSFKPYGLKTFKITGNIEVTGVETVVSSSGIDEINSRIKMFEKEIASIEPKLNKTQTPLDEEVSKKIDIVKEEILKAKNCLSDKKFYSALKHIDGFRLQDTMESLKRR